MKVLIVTPGYPPAVGGIETHTQQLAKQLEMRDIDTTVVWLNNSDLDPIQDVSNPPVENKRIRRSERWPPITVQNYHHLGAAVESTKPDIVHAHSLWYSYAMAPILLRPSAPRFVVTNHSSHFLDNYYSDSVLTNLKLRLAGRWPDMCITPSRELQTTTANICPAPVVWIPNGVDVEEFSPQRPLEPIDLIDLDSIKNKFVVLTTRRFEPKNGMRYLIESIPETHKDIFFIMIGDGSERQELKQWVNDHDLSDRVLMPGSISHEDIAIYYQYADICALPSLREATSISGLESMASGTPLVGTRVGGITELIDHEKNGYLVEPGSSEGIAKGINRAYANPIMINEMGREARKKIVEFFSWNSVAERTIEVYKSVL